MSPGCVSAASACRAGSDRWRLSLARANEAGMLGWLRPSCQTINSKRSPSACRPGFGNFPGSPRRRNSCRGTSALGTEGLEAADARCEAPAPVSELMRWQSQSQCHESLSLGPSWAIFEDVEERASRQCQRALRQERERLSEGGRGASAPADVLEQDSSSPITSTCLSSFLLKIHSVRAQSSVPWAVLSVSWCCDKLRDHRGVSEAAASVAGWLSAPSHGDNPRGSPVAT